MKRIESNNRWDIFEENAIAHKETMMSKLRMNPTTVKKLADPLI
jgi:hypothetical protein